MGRFAILVGTCVVGTVLTGQDSTKLSKAVLTGKVDKVQAALSAGEPINAYDKWGWTPMAWAIYYRYTPVVELLIQHRADLNLPTRKVYGPIPVGSTPLVISAYYGLDELITVLLKAGADPTIPNSAQKRAADYAQEFGYESTLELLKPKPKAKPAPTPAPSAPAPKPTPVAEPAVPRTVPQPVVTLDAPKPATPKPTVTPAAPAAKEAKKTKKPEPKKPEAKKPEPKKSEPPAIK